MKKKNSMVHEIGHDLLVIGLLFILGYISWIAYTKFKALDEKEIIIIAKQQETNRAWEEVNKAYERKAKLEEDALKVESKILNLEKKIQDTKDSYKRIERIQKDLDRIIGK